MKQLSLPPSLNPNAYHHQQQTSFQRCWLHRIADRFHIRREPGVYGNPQPIPPAQPTSVQHLWNANHGDTCTAAAAGHASTTGSSNMSDGSSIMLQQQSLPFKTLRLLTTPHTTMPSLTLQEYYNTTVLPALQQQQQLMMMSQHAPSGDPSYETMDGTTNVTTIDHTQNNQKSNETSTVAVETMMMTSLSIAPTTTPTDDSGNPESVIPTPPAPMKIMKRTSSSSKLPNQKGNKPMTTLQQQPSNLSLNSGGGGDGGGSSNNSVNNDSNTTGPTMSLLDSAYEEKERAYAEARARIFQEDHPQQNPEINTVNNDGVVNDNHTSHEATFGPDHSEAGRLAPQSSSSSLLQQSDDKNCTDDSNDFYYQQQQQQQTSAASSSTMRAVYRNRFQEEADPDFQRNHAYHNHHPHFVQQQQQQQQYMAMMMAMNHPGQAHPASLQFNHASNNAIPQPSLPHAPQPLMMMTVPPQTSPTNTTTGTPSSYATAATRSFANVVNSQPLPASAPETYNHNLPNIHPYQQQQPHIQMSMQQYPPYHQYHYPMTAGTDSTTQRQQPLDEWHDSSATNNDDNVVKVNDNTNGFDQVDQQAALPKLKAAAQEFVPQWQQQKSPP